MRKPDEIALFGALRAGEHRRERAPGIGYYAAMLAVCARVGMHEKRCMYLLNKWSGRGWWEWGTNVFGGWFTPEAPLVIGENVELFLVQSPLDIRNIVPI